MTMVWNCLRATMFALVAGACLFPVAGHAQSKVEFPNRPVRLLVPVAAGGGLDITTRTVAQKMTQSWGQQVLVDNRPSAGGVLAFDLTIKATPDGHTLLSMSADHVINSVPSPSRPYDITRDVAAVSQMTALSYLVYSHPSMPFTNFRELVSYARANPEKLNYGTPGPGSLQHLGWEVLGQMTGIKLTHVPYKGGAPAIAATVAGDVQVGFITLTSARPLMQGSRIRTLAAASRARMPAMPDVPTVAESGFPGYELNQYYGVMTAAKTPPAIVRKISDTIAAAVKAPDIQQRFEPEGWELVGSTPEEFRKVIRDDLDKWTKITKSIGLTLNQ